MLAPHKIKKIIRSNKVRKESALIFLIVGIIANSTNPERGSSNRYDG
jgi:hypothetical protein